MYTCHCLLKNLDLRMVIEMMIRPMPFIKDRQPLMFMTSFEFTDSVELTKQTRNSRLQMHVLHTLPIFCAHDILTFLLDMNAFSVSEDCMQTQ